MNITTADSSERIVHISISGRMDTASVHAQEARFYALFAPRGASAIFDLSAVTFLASMGIRLLITGAKTAQAKGARVVIVAPPGPVRDTLDLAAIERLIPFAEDVPSARALLGPDGSTIR